MGRLIKGIFWLALGLFILKAYDTYSTNQKTVAAAVPLDFSKPIYTKRNAIVCPLSLFDDPRADRDARAIRDLWLSVWDRRNKVKEMGCQEWSDGVLVRAWPRFPEMKSSIVIVNDTFFTQQFDLRN